MLLVNNKMRKQAISILRADMRYLEMAKRFKVLTCILNRLLRLFHQFIRKINQIQFDY